MFGLLGARDDALNIGKQIVLVKAEVMGTSPFIIFKSDIV